MKKHTYLPAILLLLVQTNLFSQSLSSSIADWKNGAKGAYSIIHDDYGSVGVDGIWEYADTIAANRGLKFTFGAISSECEMNRNVKGYSSPYSYAKEVMMAVHNHEIINHTHTHTCAINRGWSPCNGTGWGEVKNVGSWDMELNTSHNSIFTNTGFQPRYFIYPYDQFTDIANDELAAMGYLGSRTGWHVDGYHSTFYKYGYEANDENMFKCESNGFFRTSVQVFDDIDEQKSDAAQTAELNSVVDDAINYNEWGNRELHNVGYSGWGHVKVAAYRDHLNYVKSKVDAGDLWMPTMSEMLTYQVQKLVYTPSSTYSSTSKKINTTFSENHSVFSGDVATYLSGLTIKTPVTVGINVAAYTGIIDFQNAIIKQGSTTITDFLFDGTTLYVNLYPNEGSFTIEDPGNVLVNEYFDNSNFNIYPNPVQNYLMVDGEVSSLAIFSIRGDQLLRTNSSKIDLSQLSPGIYCLHINGIATKEKIVKQ